VFFGFFVSTQLVGLWSGFVLGFGTAWALSLGLFFVGLRKTAQSKAAALSGMGAAHWAIHCGVGPG